MTELKIITDHKWKPFRYRYEVPQKVLDSEFDYQDPEDTLDGFFCYRKVWYHLDQFTVNIAPWGCLSAESPLMQWDAHLSDSFFSGVVIRVSEDFEEYQVGTFIA